MKKKRGDESIMIIDFRKWQRIGGGFASGKGHFAASFRESDKGCDSVRGNRTAGRCALSICIVIVLMLTTTTALIAQPPPYYNAAGVRAGYSNGLNYKRFFDTQQATDIYALYHPDAFQLYGLYEYQVSPHFKNRLQYYFGAGVFAGNWASEFSIGPSAVAGGEFIFREIPLIIGLQWKPMLNAWKQFDIVWYDFGLTVMIVIN